MMEFTGFSNPSLAVKLLEAIRENASSCAAATVMEVCGTHTMEIGRLGLRPLLPENIRLVSGPGCPVCVTPGHIIDAAATGALERGAVLLSFGDMLRVPGNRTSFERASASGADVRVVLSPLQVIAMAEAEPRKQFFVVAVGFETTIPAVARSVLVAEERNLDNVRFLVAHRLVPPALRVLAADPRLAINAFLLPGHVSAIIGANAYGVLDEAGVAGVIAGFEPLDILGGLCAAVEMVAKKRSGVRNMYSRAVRHRGNERAMRCIDEVFEPVDAVWRGIGVIPQSGLALRPRFARFDAAPFCPMAAQDDMPEGCSCGQVLKGILRPDGCPLFGAACTPQSPVGPCMVSSEGSCAAYYRYGG